ncbi:MAG: M48 family metallopeptidase [Elusimicrobiota bacterium]
MEIKINYSQNRTNTISAKIVDNVMYVKAPSGVQESHLQKVVESFKKRFEKRKLRKELNKSPEMLRSIAEELNKKYFDGKLEIKSIEYSAEQDKKYGVCNYNTKTIRISYRLKDMPEWVRNYVIIHELAHLIEPNHGENFHSLVNRYKLVERAKGYLIAKGLESFEKETEDIGA